MEARKNLCAMLPVALHTRVRQEQEKAGMTLGEYVEAMITEYYDWKDGKIMTGEMRTLPCREQPPGDHQPRHFPPHTGRTGAAKGPPTKIG